MPKIAFIGAGSTVFAKNLMGDILSHPELAESTIVLHDIDEHRLELSRRVGLRVAETLGVKPQFIATTDRERALEGADYAINMIQVGGYEPSTVIDFEIPKQFGLRQTIGDTLGVGGIMRALRTVPVLLEMAHDMERLAPDVLHINYVNPMAMNCMALDRATNIQTVGLCHSVPHTAGELAADLDLPEDELDYLVAGINHVAFFLRLEHAGKSVYPELRRVLREGRIPDHNRARYELFEQFGYFVTESSEHLAEYVPWFIKEGRNDLLERYNIPIDEYLYRSQAGIASWDFIERELEQPGSQNPDLLRAKLEETPLMPTMVEGAVEAFASLNEVNRSSEYGAQIIHAIETDTPTRIYGNVPNRGLIENLPDDACVELPALVDGQGVQPTQIGRIPPHLAALMQTNINVQSLTVEALITENREHVYHAAMLDPHTAAELDLKQIRDLVDALIEAHGDMIPEALRH